MINRLKCNFREISLVHYLIIVIIGIIILVTGVLLAISYTHAEEVVLKLDEYFQDYTELNVRERISLVDSGLTLYDSGMNDRVKQAFIPYLHAYNLSDGNLSRLSLPEVKAQLQRESSGTIDLYVINKSGVIIMSTVPDVLNLNLSQSPDYAARIPSLINGSSFAADRVVRSYPSASSPYITGTLRKFAFMPTPDHQYLLEIGVADSAFAFNRGNLSYDLISDEMDDINPYLDQIRIFDMHMNQYVSGGILPPSQLDPLTIQQLNTTIQTRSDQTFVDANSGDRIRYLFINQSSPDSLTDMSVVAEITFSDTLLQEEMHQLISFFVGVGIFAILFGLIITLGASFLMTRPISEIIEDVDIISHGDMDHSIRNVRVREFIRLKQSITLMIRQIRSATMEIEHRKTELSIASDIQQSFLPDIIPVLPGFDMSARSIPAKEVGGDFYDIIPLQTEEKLSTGYGVVIADVSGKGVPAALFMALSRTIIRVITGQNISLPDAIKTANTFIYEDARTGMFVSLFYAMLKENSDQISYVNCGHNPPALYSASTRSTREVGEGGIVLGVDDDISLVQESITMMQGDILVLYTDGITEAIDGKNEMYGLNRLFSVIETHATRTSSEIVESILADLHTFTRGLDQFDDITLIVIKRIPLPPSYD